MKKRLFTTTLLLGFCLSASADIIVQYTFDNNLNATTLGPNIQSASTFGGNTDVAPTHSGLAGINVDGSTYTNSAPLNDVENTGGDAGRVFARTFSSTAGGDFQFYYDFSLTVEDGYFLNLDNVTFDLGFRELSASAMKVEYSTSSDFSTGVVQIGAGAGYNAEPQDFLGYGTDGTLGVTQASGFTNISWNRYTNTDNLAGNESLTGDVFFRIWLRGGESTSDGRLENVFLDNITVNGVTVIPEPGTLTLMILGMAGAGLASFRKKRV
ncbi:MAG: PEP-CTERM sorting domain-containing protein [Verrucomicrobia bacterium]|nr:PEP-CTERM sorting domain-containing protein [Verrucomicrobiota bacterium]